VFVAYLSTNHTGMPPLIYDQGTQTDRE
jgi:hypothetical protein